MSDHVILQFQNNYMAIHNGPKYQISSVGQGICPT